MSNQRLMKAKGKAGDGYAKTNAIAPPHGIGEQPALASEAKRADCVFDGVGVDAATPVIARKYSRARKQGATT